MNKDENGTDSKRFEAGEKKGRKRRGKEKNWGTHEVEFQKNSIK